MPLPRLLLLSALLCVAAGAARGVPAYPAATTNGAATGVAAAGALAGREDDARVARIAFRLAVAGAAAGRCPVAAPNPGLVLQHLSDFRLADRAGVIAALALDRGPGVIAVVPGGPAAAAGIRAGDIVLSIDGVGLPPEPGLAEPFQAARAQARADAIADLLAPSRPLVRSLTLTLLRDGGVVSARLMPVPACPSRVLLARSDQHNAYADGSHVLLTTGMLTLFRDDDELAFIVGHEMGHNILGHAAVMRGATVRHGLGRTLGRSGRIVRGTERAADALGAALMLDAGMDPVRGAAILTRLGAADFGIAAFATHDSPGRRVAAIAALAQGGSGQARPR